MTLQDPSHPPSKLAYHLPQTCPHGLPTFSDSRLNASAHALPSNVCCSFPSSSLHAQTVSFRPSPDPTGSYILSLPEIASPCPNLTYTRPVDAFIHSFTQQRFILLGNMQMFGDYHLLPCIVVIWVSILSSLLSRKLPQVQRCALTIMWGMMHAKWMNTFAVGLAGGLTEGEPSQQHVMQLSNKYLIWSG